MGEWKIEEMSLPALFEQARKIHLMASESGVDQETLRQNDISTANLKYLLVPFYLAELTEKLTQDDRTHIIKISLAKLKNSFRFVRQWSSAKKIARFKRHRAAESKLLEIKEWKERRGRSTKASALSAPVEAGEEDVLDDGEEEREAWLTTISLALYKAFDLMEMLMKEEEMLSAIKEKQLQEGDKEISQAILDERTKEAEAYHRHAAA
ncbi:hypothetical protein F0562_026745 [Nyssa sinensis]|uniref:Uncharacterized protein n=1 Tax=Nyssa sinensis TaxID=561372 RepID=A0A5J5BA82_9ASTE|nr:hypothetical protein F0562_026745 [Nyssa sinensis]